MSARNITIDDFMKAVMNSSYHGYDLTLLILSKMMKVVIALIHPDYIWMSTPDVNVLEASVVLVYDGDVLIQGTGTSLETVFLFFVVCVCVCGELLILMLSLVTKNYFTFVLTEVLTQNYRKPMPFRNKFYFNQWIAPTNLFLNAPKPATPETAPKPTIPKTAPKPTIPKTAPKPTIPKTTPKPTIPKTAPKPVNSQPPAEPAETATKESECE